MTRMPTLAAIHAAELRLAQSKRDVCDSLGRVRRSGRAALARPSTLAGIAGAACLLGIWFSRRLRPPVRAANGVAGVPSASMLGVITAFAVQYGLRHLPAIVRHFLEAREQRAAHAAPAVR